MAFSRACQSSRDRSNRANGTRISKAAALGRVLSVPLTGRRKQKTPLGSPDPKAVMLRRSWINADPTAPLLPQLLPYRPRKAWSAVDGAGRLHGLRRRITRVFFDDCGRRWATSETSSGGSEKPGVPCSIHGLGTLRKAPSRQRFGGAFDFQRSVALRRGEPIREPIARWRRRSNRAAGRSSSCGTQWA